MCGRWRRTRRPGAARCSTCGPRSDGRYRVMFLVADVKCYYCGFISGELVSPMGQSLKNGTFRPAAGVDAASSVHNGKLRCARCGGPVYTDEIRTERPKPVVTFFER